MQMHRCMCQLHDSVVLTLTCSVEAVVVHASGSASGEPSKCSRREGRRAVFRIRGMFPLLP